ncbi:MAG: hypothetical protein AMXMBFR34_17320 [Myxococcaceae bacterium]
MLRLLGAAFPALLGPSRGAAALRILVVAGLGTGLPLLAAVLLQDFWAAV